MSSSGDGAARDSDVATGAGISPANAGTVLVSTCGYDSAALNDDIATSATASAAYTGTITITRRRDVSPFYLDIATGGLSV